MLSPKRYRDDSINTTYFNTIDSYSSPHDSSTAGQPSVSTSCYYTYKDIFEPVIGTTLTLQLKPENAKDPDAVAIVEDTGRIVGHIP